MYGRTMIEGKKVIVNRELDGTLRCMMVTCNYVTASIDALKNHSKKHVGETRVVNRTTNESVDPRVEVSEGK